MVEELEERDLRPVDVLDDEHDGPVGRRCSRRRRTAQNSSSTGKGSSVSPIADDSRSVTPSPAAPACERELGPRLGGRRPRSRSPPASATGLGDRPEGNPFPIREASALEGRARSAGGDLLRNSDVRRDFPTPASADDRHEFVSWYASRRPLSRAILHGVRSSSSRPTSGASPRGPCLARRRWDADEAVRGNGL